MSRFENRFTGAGRIANPRLDMVGDKNIPKLTFTICIGRPYTKADQEAKKERQTDFIRCVAWNNLADWIVKSLADEGNGPQGLSGKAIFVEGEVRTGQYTGKDGATVYTTDLVVENFKNPEYFVSKSEAQSAPKAQPKTPSEAPSNWEEIDEEIPF